MTGFGRGSIESSAYSVTCEIKSLNGKYFDAEIRLPRYLAELDNEIRKMLTDTLERGTVYVNYNIVLKSLNSGAGESENLINKPLALAYYAQLKKLSEELNVEFINPVAELMKIPDILSGPEKSADAQLMELIKTATKDAAQKLIEFRNTEGAQCGIGLIANIEKIKVNLKSVQSHEQARRDNLRTKMYANIEEHVANNISDKSRLEQEILIYLEKWDVSEEIQRLSQHLEYFIECIKKEPKGRKLNFISQEMGREMNTLGVKSNYFPMQQNVVEMKEELEKIKEQVLNLV